MRLFNIIFFLIFLQLIFTIPIDLLISSSLFLLFIPSLFYSIYLIVKFIKFIVEYFIYINTSYFKSTKNSYFSIMRDKGKMGEYLIYTKLKFFEELNCKFLFNVYIPKGKNETSEIDAIMISPKGLFVFESKNFKGWIFGNEKDKYWTQTLPIRIGFSKKRHFYNPIMQNANHIEHLKNFLDIDIKTFSIIVFSHECSFKNLTLGKSAGTVVRRNTLLRTVTDLFIFSPDTLSLKEVDLIYDLLRTQTNVSNKAKNQHIRNITNKFNPQTIKERSNPIFNLYSKILPKLKESFNKIIILIKSLSNKQKEHNNERGC